MFGIGAAIGSVPPAESHACVRNVSFLNWNFTYPIKAVYVKTNPGYKGTGEIKNIRYENMNIDTPLWWPIYIGPQQ
jgi:hypothetical protein